MRRIVLIVALAAVGCGADPEPAPAADAGSVAPSKFNYSCEASWPSGTDGRTGPFCVASAEEARDLASAKCGGSCTGGECKPYGTGCE